MKAMMDPVYRTLWTENLEDVDREIVRLALLCQVQLLQPGIAARVLKRDASVCGTPNAAAFAKLRDLLMLHLRLREKFLDSFGPAQTEAIESYVVARLRKSFTDLPGESPARAMKTGRSKRWRLPLLLAVCAAFALVIALLIVA
ncbi:MAG TPA: hypothetical protein VGX52_02770 [Burkholderiales bacterium]|nr:hypothetical protein [Burkholderiales bacterium]